MIVGLLSEGLLSSSEILCFAALGAFALHILAHDQEQGFQSRLETCFRQRSLENSEQFFAAALLQQGVGISELLIDKLLAFCNLALLLGQAF